MRYILLTWNPGRNDDLIWTPDQFRDAVVVPTMGSDSVRLSWSVGKQTAVDVGDRAFLFRQGEHGRGVIATGVIARGPELGVHYDDPSKMTNYVLIDWMDAMPVEGRIDLSELEASIPGFDWRKVFFSGRVLPEAYGVRLGEMIAERTGGGISAPLVDRAFEHGQGLGTAEHNAAVEAAAVDRVTLEWEEAGYEVIDVSDQCLGWDLTAYDEDGSEFHIEVKGTSGPARRFRLTANEYRKCQEDEEWVLAIVTNALDQAPDDYHEEFDRQQILLAAVPMTYAVQLD